MVPLSMKLIDPLHGFHIHLHLFFRIEYFYILNIYIHRPLTRFQGYGIFEVEYQYYGHSSYSTLI